MKLKYVVTGVNENPLYTKCIPFFIKAWESFDQEIHVKVVLFATKIPDFLTEYESYIYLIQPISGVSTAFSSQIVRLFYPCLLPNDGAVIISDVDLLPLNYDYFYSALSSCDKNQFVTFRADWMKKRKWNEVVMCYNAAYSSVWSEVFGIKTHDQMLKKMSAIYESTEYEDIHNGKGWRTDQQFLFKVLSEWSAKDKKHFEYSDEDLDFNRMTAKVVDDIGAALNWIKKNKPTDIHLNKDQMFSKDQNQRNIYQRLIESYIQVSIEK